MFKAQLPLEFGKHPGLRLLETNDYGYAAGEILAPITFDEMGEVAREYPIVFPDNGSELPAALLGLEAGHNAYVGPGGQWRGTYVPAHIRRYPFALGGTGRKEGGAERYIVMFDPDAPHFKEPNGHAVFDADGKPTEHMKRRLALLESIQKTLPATRSLVKSIAEAGLLVERVIRLKKSEGEHRIQGLRVIDEKKLNQMPGDEFLALRDKGALPLVYSHLLSWANFRQGPLAGRYPDLAAKPETRNPAFLFESGLVDLSSLS